MKEESLTVLAAKTTPSATVGMLTLFGYQLSEVVMLVTLFYTLLQLGFFVKEKYDKYKKKE